MAGVRTGDVTREQRSSPWSAPLHTVLRHIDREAVEAPLGAWAEALLGEEPGPTAGALPHLTHPCATATSRQPANGNSCTIKMIHGFELQPQRDTC